MKLLLIHRYFWPDTPPYASLLRAIAEQLAADGHDVYVFSTQPSYKKEYEVEPQPSFEKANGVNIIRSTFLRENGIFWRRIVNGFLFGLGILRVAGKHGRFDLIMTSTSPPILPGFFGNLAARFNGCHFYYHCQDLQPEAALLAGVLKRGLLYDFLLKLDRRNCEGAFKIIVLSEDMKLQLARRGVNDVESKVKVINNFAIPSSVDFFVDVEFPLKNSKCLKLLFAGNLGVYQGLSKLIEGVRRAVNEGAEIEMLFLGEGVAKEHLIKKSGELLNHRIFFLPHASVEVAKTYMSLVDYGVVSIIPGVNQVAYPSKIMTYLSAGLPIFGVVPRDSELGEMICNNEIGLIAEPADVIDISRSLKRLSRQHCEVASNNVAATYYSNFHQDVILDKWSKLIH